jgi:hypothetical protein
MDREKLRAALRVLSSIYASKPANASDVDLIKASALPEERDLELDDLARHVAERNRHPWIKI